MGVVVLASAGGSPGVTTTALGLALVWPRPVLLVEADPTGASAILPGYLQGAPVPARCLIDLAIAHQQGHLAQTLLALAVPLNASAKLIPAIKTRRQAAAMAGVWEPLADALRDLDQAGTDVIVDAGRLGLEFSPTPLLARADAVLLVTRCTLPALATARVWTPWLAELSEQQPIIPGLCLIGPGDAYPAGEIGRGLRLRARATLPLDPAAARVLSEGDARSPRRFGRSPLVTALKAEAAGLAKLIDEPVAEARRAA
jgi:hypothetical protein